MAAAGFGDMCGANPQFNGISYNYTTNSTLECRRMGEVLWEDLQDMFGACLPDEEPVTIGRSHLSRWPAALRSGLSPGPVLDAD